MTSFPHLQFCTSIIVILCLFVNVLSSPPTDSILVFQQGEGGYYCHKIPYIIRTSSNVLIALAEGRGKNGRDACDDFAGTDLVYKRSFDEGLTWTELLILYTNSSATETNVIGNAAPVQDIRNGRIWMPFCRNNEQVYMTYSDDDGQTWSTPRIQPQLVKNLEWAWVGLGPPSGLQLSSGRLLIPGYHTIKVKGDGLISHGHTLISDDGKKWKIGSSAFGSPYLLNENQAVELKNKSVLINARTLVSRRIQVISNDGGLTFDSPYVVPGLVEAFEGCEGSIVRDPSTEFLYYSGTNSPTLVRRNMTVFQSNDEGASWTVLKTVDLGSVAYSALVILSQGKLGLLYERSDVETLIFEPQEIRFWRVI